MALSKLNVPNKPAFLRHAVYSLNVLYWRSIRCPLKRREGENHYASFFHEIYVVLAFFFHVDPPCHKYATEEPELKGEKLIINWSLNETLASEGSLLLDLLPVVAIKNMVSCWVQSNANARELISHIDSGHQVSTREKERFLISPACRV